MIARAPRHPRGDEKSTLGGGSSLLGEDGLGGRAFDGGDFDAARGSEPTGLRAFAPILGNKLLDSSTVEPYDSVEHLAKTVWPSKRWAEVLMGVMYTACFDASGHETGQEFLVVAGFLSSANDWIKFDYAWNKRLAKDNLTYLHMREFAHKRPPFHKLTEIQRRALLSDLMEIIRAHAYRKFVSTVQNKVMRSELSDEMKAQYYFNSYVMAARDAVSMLGLWMKSQKMTSPLQLVFAKGDVGEGDLRRRLEEDGYIDVQYRYSMDTVIEGKLHPGFIPLQASDFLAYESFKAIKAKSIDRWAFDSFIGMPGQMGIQTEEDLNETLQWIKVSEEVTKWILDRNIPLPKGTVLKKKRKIQVKKKRA